MAVGKAGEAADRDRLSIRFGTTIVAREGRRVPDYDEAPVARHLKEIDVEIGVDLGLGDGCARVDLDAWLHLHQRGLPLVTSSTQPVAALMREAASRFIMPRYGRLAAHEHEEKAAGEDVTIADRESEAFLTEKLAALVPGSKVVGEEACADRSRHARYDRRWRGLADRPPGRHDEFQECRGAVRRHDRAPRRRETHGARILDPRRPALSMLYRGAGAYVDGDRVHSRGSGQAQPVAAISDSVPSGQRADANRSARGGPVRNGSIPRCAAEQYPRLVLGENDLTLFWRTLPWDHAPGTLFLEEAGGRIARLDGSPYRPAEQRRWFAGRYARTLGPCAPAPSVLRRTLT